MGRKFNNRHFLEARSSNVNWQISLNYRSECSNISVVLYYVLVLLLSDCYLCFPSLFVALPREPYQSGDTVRRKFGAMVKGVIFTYAVPVDYVRHVTR